MMENVWDTDEALLREQHQAISYPPRPLRSEGEYDTTSLWVWVSDMLTCEMTSTHLSPARALYQSSPALYVT